LKKILIIFAHPALQKSRVNKVLIEDLPNKESITFHDIYQTYPELDIDVPTEKVLLEKHDIIVLQHPFFWYSTPAILKEWQDLVLEHGWAYGSEGNALKNKILFNVITTGGRKEAYCENGYNNYTVRQLLSPIEQTANLCKMIFLPPYVIHGTNSITEEEVHQHRDEYYQLLNLLANDQIDIRKARMSNYLNDFVKLAKGKK
jgi:glutathione-regulated potassium-efflux system ancillary protein KefG